MDMEMDMSSQATPANINEPYSKNLVTIISSVICFLILRYICISIYNKARTSPVLKPIWTLTSPFGALYSRYENNVINRFSYTPLYGYCPPLGAIFIVLALISAIIPLLLLNNDLKVNSNRAGFLVLALFPFVLSSTGKNSAVSFLTGISSVRLNFIHRILGLALWLCATVHMSCMLYSWAKFPSFLQSQLQLPKVQYGLTAYGFLSVLVLGSTFPIRKLCYEAFLVTHMLGIVFIGVIAVHTPYAMRYFMTGLVCYGLNLSAVWCVKTFIAHAKCELMPEGCTKINIRLASPMSVHSIGQHVNVCIPLVSPFQWHPFTITSVQQKNSKYHTFVEICVIARGNFTRQLYEKINPSEEIRLFVSGPFGSSDIKPDRILEKQSRIIIASGGAGITFGMRLLRELTDMLIMKDDAEMHDESDSKPCLNYYKTKSVHFHWSVRLAGELEWFRRELEQIKYVYDTHSQFPDLDMKFYVTRDLDGRNCITEVTSTGSIKTDTFEKYDTDMPKTPSQSSNVTNLEGSEQTCVLLDGSELKGLPRKQVDTIFGQRIEPKLLLSPDNEETGIYVCGPSGFNTCFKNTVATLSNKKSSRVRLHCEDFSY